MGGQIRRGWIWRFWGAPIFSPKVPKYLFQRVLGPLDRKSGRPQNAKFNHDGSDPPFTALSFRGFPRAHGFCLGPLHSKSVAFCVCTQTKITCSLCHLCFVVKEFPLFDRLISANFGYFRLISAKNRPIFDSNWTTSQLKSTKWGLFISHLRWWERTPNKLRFQKQRKGWAFAHLTLLPCATSTHS